MLCGNHLKSIPPIFPPNKCIREIPRWVLAQQLCNYAIIACRYIYDLERYALEKCSEWRPFNCFEDYRTPVKEIIECELNQISFSNFQKVS